MKIDKKGFLHTLPGYGMRACAQLLDEALKKKNQCLDKPLEYDLHCWEADYCKAQIK